MREEVLLDTIKKNWIPDSQFIGLVGFALRTKKAVKGFESVSRGVVKNEIRLVVVSDKISSGTLGKINHLLNKKNILLISLPSTVDWDALWGLGSYKVLGFLQGDISESIVRILIGSINGGKKDAKKIV